jgi:hypothetical protein
MKKVIAIAKGYDGVVVRNPGDVFEVADGAKGSWFKAADGDTKGPAAKASKPAKATKAKVDEAEEDSALA